MQKNQKIFDSLFIDRLLLFSIGVFCVLYSIFWNKFAQVHVKFDFLDFPIFVGEIFLAFCLLLTSFKIYSQKSGLKKWHLLIMAYMGWVLTKTFLGYYAYGPFAFRTAALFYYPLFAVISYVIYQDNIFNETIINALVVSLFIIGTVIGVHSYYLLPYFLMHCVLISKISNKRTKYFLFGLLFLTTPFHRFFIGGKSIIVGSTVALTFLIGFLFIVFTRFKLRHKVMGISLGMIIIIGGFFAFAAKSHVHALTSPVEFIQSFKRIDNHIEKEKRGYQAKPLSVSLFNQNDGTRPLGPSRKHLTAFTYYTQLQDYSDEVIIDKIEKTKDQQSVLKLIKEISRKRFAPALVNAKKNIDIHKLSVQVRIKQFFDDVEKQKNELNIIEKVYADVLNVVENSFARRENQIFEDMKSVLAEQSEYDAKGLAVKFVHALNNMKIYEDQALDEASKISVNYHNDQEYSQYIYQKICRGASYHQYLVGRNPLKRSPLDSIPPHLKKRKKTIPTPELSEEEKEHARVAALFVEKLGYSHMFFRFFIWRDLGSELINTKAWLGMSFGKPQRSPSVEILQLAYYEWLRDGWIAIHSSYLHILYRSGILGIVFIMTILGVFLSIVKKSVELKSLTGILLSSVLIYWLTMASFLDFFELPYHAIPCWSLFGLTYGYIRKQII